MFALSFNALTLVAAIVVSVSWTDGAATKDPPKCCFPDQFTILKSTTTGDVMEGQPSPLALIELQDIGFDFNNNRVGANVTRYFYTGQPSENYWIREDLTKKLLWVIDPAKKTCVKQNIDSLPFRCIPENATYGGLNYFGNKDLNVDTWSFAVKDYLQTSGQFSLTVKTDKCIPVGDTFVGTSTAGGIKQQIVSTSGYLNFVEGIKDPDKYFNLPEYCPKEPTKLQTLLEKTKP